MHKNHALLLTKVKGLVFLFLFVGLATQTYAQVYSWKDENGRVHFGDTPPENQAGLEVKSLTIKEKNPTGNSDEVVQRRKARQADLLRDMEQASQKREEEKAKKREQKKQKELKCQRAKSRVKHNKRYSVIFREAPNGERAYLNDEQRKAYDKELQDQVAKYCP
jgi:regulator of protease activity HflC (stomatin/prohibitin superfamily)